MTGRIKRVVCALCAGALLSASAGATDWGLWYGKGANQPPQGEDSVQTLAQYGAYFMGDTTQKNLYLTFDCGYENGYTAKILDVLKKHHAPAAFFMVGDYLDTAPELSKRMAEEGHILGNHSNKHPNMTKVSKTRFEQELRTLSQKYQNLTGQQIAPFYRPPEGSYTYENLKWAQAMGYHTILWSVAYADWDTSKQPSRESALKTLNSRVHPGAIVLLHTVSATNAAILDELLTQWEQQGYTFSYLSALPGLSNPPKTAVPSDCTFMLNGTVKQIGAYQIDGANYVNLRDMAAAMNDTARTFGVSYDTQTNTVAIQCGQMYQPTGAEGQGQADVAAMQAYAGTQPILVDGVPKTLDVYVIGGANYIKLRDFSPWLITDIAYNDTLQQVEIQI